ncbi:MAG: hypothetical protein QMC80_05545 [Thermoplasmatales archaeon]|nr:hypothetical protein [Thermoplasmatales archaeon]
MNIKLNSAALDFNVKSYQKQFRLQSLPTVFQAWNLITDGSMSAELRQEKDIIGLSIDSNVFSVDIGDAKHPIILALKNMGYSLKKKPDAGITKEKTPKLNWGKKIFGMLHKIQGIADVLAENKKTFVLKHRNKEILRIGDKSESVSLRILGFRHIQIPSKIALLRFLMEIR